MMLNTLYYHIVIIWQSKFVIFGLNTLASSDDQNDINTCCVGSQQSLNQEYLSHRVRRSNGSPLSLSLCRCIFQTTHLSNRSCLVHHSRHLKKAKIHEGGVCACVCVCVCEKICYSLVHLFWLEFYERL